MGRLLKLLVWFLAFILLAAVAQKGPTNQASMAGLNLTLKGCTLSGDTLRCTVEVSNPQTKAISANITPASVVALTASGWLYQGQASTNSLKLGPGGKTTLTLTFRGVNDPSGLFAMIQVGEARFLGVVVPGAPKMVAKDGYCFFLSSLADSGLVCHLNVSNDTDTDLTLRLYPRASFVVSELGAIYEGTKVVLGERLFKFNEAVDVTIPARTTTRLGVLFGEAQFGQQRGYLLQKMQLVRFQVSGGYFELRDVPVKYCGQNNDSDCYSLQPF